MIRKYKVKPSKCKICGKEFIKSRSTQKVCSVDCAMKFSKEQARKKREKLDKQARREHRQRLEAIKTRSQWLKDLQKVFNEFIRLRDKDDPCISCGKFHQGQWHAGHYKTVKAMPELRFNEDNCHKQCSVCNNYLSGNLTDYRINLIKKIGVERVEFLERKDHKKVKLTIDEIKELIVTYKNKIKELR